MNKNELYSNGYVYICSNILNLIEINMYIIYIDKKKKKLIRIDQKLIPVFKSELVFKLRH